MIFVKILKQHNNVLGALTQKYLYIVINDTFLENVEKSSLS